MQTDASSAINPLAETLSRLGSVVESFYADTGALEADWLPAADLVRASSPALDAALAQQALEFPQMDARTRGSYLIGSYSWYVAGIAIGMYLTAKRVPDLSPENLALRFSKYTWHEGENSGEAERMDLRFLSGRFAALPDDPAADHPDAILMPDALALREWLRDALERHFAPLIEQIRSRTRLGQHAQWCLVADTCAALFLYGGKLIGDAELGAAEGLAFVRADGSPMKNPNTGYLSLQYLEHTEIFRTRGGCCRYYTVAEDGYKCSTCVLRKPEERDQILLDYMSRKYAGDAAS